MIPNMNYQNLKESYLFYNIAQKTKAYLEAHPGAHLYRMGIGDVSRNAEIRNFGQPLRHTIKKEE